MDAQHAVIEDADRLEQALAAGANSAALSKILGQLDGYANDHFPAEERLMAATDYPLRTQHAVEHRRGLRQLRAMERMVEEGRPVPAMEMLRQLREWHQRHILDWDSRLVKFLNEPGRAGLS